MKISSFSALCRGVAIWGPLLSIVSESPVVTVVRQLIFGWALVSEKASIYIGALGTTRPTALGFRMPMGRAVCPQTAAENFIFPFSPARWGQRALPMTYRTSLERLVLKPPQEIPSFIPQPVVLMPSIRRFSLPGTFPFKPSS